MLEKIICIDNVGVIRKGIFRPVELQKVALIYADNARGKSTLSSLLLACSGFDAQDVVQRKTIGATTTQKIILRFNPPDGTGAFNAEFDGTAWKGRQPNLHVFNQSFVERNVYASTGVMPEQREALLNLALGDAAVVQRTKFDDQSALQRECAGKVNATEGALQGYRGTLTVNQFIALQSMADVDSQIAEVETQVSEARTAEQVSKRPQFKMVEVPTFNFDGLSEVLASSFESLSVDAEKTAKAHFAKHKGAGTERWASEGLSHLPEEDCPFCGQPTGELDLLKAYKLYFDGSYSDHQMRISNLRDEVMRRLGEQQLASWTVSHEFNQGLLNVWDESLGITELPSLEYGKAIKTLKMVEVELLMVVGAKESNPLAALDPSPLAKALVTLQGVVELAQDFNAQVAKLNEQVAAYKAKLAKPDITALNAKRAELAVRKNRYETEVVDLVDEVTKARAAHKAAETAKDAARAELDRLMEATLTKFQGSINEWLGKFAAPFQVDQLAPTYKGGGLRSEYVLKVRGVSVNVGPGGGGQLPFHSALSEGDKRTLAFAFFLARLFADPDRANASVVLDDVFTSLDKHRRHNTIEAMLRMINECAQVIALGHDAHFLREIKKRVGRKQLGITIELALQRDGDDYSYLDCFDLDDYCSSAYYKHYVLVERFVDGDNTVSLLEVAKALRLLVEGHLHRCFPKKFKEGQTVGEMLGQVKSATAPNPLALLHPLHAELVSFNEFAAAFHHDTSGGYTRTEVNAAELLPFAKGSLGFIQIRSFK